MSGCSGTITAMSYICTDFSIQENWSFGERFIAYSNDVALFNVADEVTIGFTGCCWISSVGGSWSLSTRLSLVKRNDTGRINSTPRAITAPVIRLQEGCNHTLALAVSDPDGDDVRCRWASTNLECGGICSTFPGAVLDSASCMITYWANQGAGYKAAAIMLEDFSPGQSEPFSSVGLQFLVLVVSSNSPCSQKPTFIHPTLPQATCVAIPAMATFMTQLTATSGGTGVSITEIQTTSPLGTSKGVLQHVVGTNTYYVNITWTPEPNQYNQTHLFCYTALNSAGLASEQTCIQFLTAHLPPTLINGTNIPNQEMVHPSNTTWHARFDTAIQRPSLAAFIIFYDNNTGNEVYRIDASLSPEISFHVSNEVSIRPNYIFAEKKKFYIQLSRGIVQGISGCGAGNEPIVDIDFWVFETIDVTPPMIHFTANPSISNTNITISWESNESVAWQCILISGNVESVVNCSGAFWRGYDMSEGTYSLNVSGIDKAGNKATVVHMFMVDLTPPTTVIKAKPKAISNQLNPRFNFVCNDVGCTYECQFSKINNASQKLSQSCNGGFFDTPTLEHNYTYVFQVSATDIVGNKGIFANYTWDTDFESPHIFVIDNVTVQCTDTSPMHTGQPMAVDNRSGIVPTTYVDFNLGCSIKRTWRATDEAGNTASLLQYIDLDFQPSISLAPQVLLKCDSTADAVTVSTMTAHAINPCNLPFQLTHIDSIDNYTCPAQFTRNWTIAICSKKATASQVISVYDVCPVHACGRNETKPRGACIFGECLCNKPWHGNDCSVLIYEPVLQAINHTVLKEAQEYIANVTLSMGTKPFSWRVLSGPNGLNINGNLGQVIWNRAHAGNHTIAVEVENQIGRAEVEWTLEVKPGYNATIDHASGSIFSQAQPVILMGHVEYVAGNLVKESLAGVVLVEIDIIANEATRTLKASTTQDGEFSLTFYPTATEYGSYTAAARHPSSSKVFSQVEWSFLGMKAMPRVVSLRGETMNSFMDTFHNATTILNDGPEALSGLTAIALINSEDLNVIASFQNVPSNGSIAPGNAIQMDITVTASQPVQHTFTIEIHSFQNTTVELIVQLYVAQILPSFLIEPSSINTRIIRGSSRVLQFNITNVGRATANNVQAILPSTNIISFISFGQNGSSPRLNLKTGESATLSILIQTPQSQQLGEISASMAISSAEASKAIPVFLIVSSNLLLDLTVVVEDEYTYFAEGRPLVDNAIVTILNYQRNIRMTNGTDSRNGSVIFYNIIEDRYELTVEAPNHRSARQVIITSSDNPVVTIFIERQAVIYRWSVTQVTYEDTYSLVIEADFETNVPIPVVTVTPMEFDLDELERGFIDSIQLNITNHGLIRADDVEIQLPTTHPFLEFSIANEDLGNLNPLTSIIATVRITRRHVQKRAAPAVVLVYAIQVLHSFVCNERQFRITPIFLKKDPPPAPPSSGNRVPSFPRLRYYGGGNGGNGGNGPGLPEFSSIPYSAVTPAFCNKCLQAVVSCIPTPIFRFSGCIPLLIGQKSPLESVQNALSWLGCDVDNKWLGPLNCFLGLFNEDCKRIAQSLVGRRKRALSSRVDELLDGIFPIHQSMKLGEEVLGDQIWLSVSDPELLSHIYGSMDDGSESGVLISITELSSILALNPPNGTNTEMVRELVERLNNTLHGWTTGQLEPEDGSNIASFNTTRKYEEDIFLFNEKAKSKGFSSYLDAYSVARDDINQLDRWEEEEGVCAVVRIRIEQELAVTREAFLAKLEIENKENLPLEQIELEIVIVDSTNGNVATSLFSISNETLSGSLVKDGSKWLLGSGMSGQVEWLIAPYSEAAPHSDKEYDIRGTLRYVLDMEDITIPLLPTLITVKPDPSLIVHYFWEKKVIADDPFTDEREPSVPFTLGVAIRNKGAGVATDLRITSGQPEIIENEKGLLVNFMIIGANIGIGNITPSLTVTFGDLLPNTTTVARWFMISSLQGEFRNYSAVFENKNPLGDPKLSILDDLQIHELFRNVEMYDSSEDDGIPDFLVIARNRPSELYSSKTLQQYAVNPGEVISVHITSTNSLSLEVRTKANCTGWIYYRYEDSQNMLQNTALFLNTTKQEGNTTSHIPSTNAWITSEKDSSKSTETFFLHVVDNIQSMDEVVFTMTLCTVNCTGVEVPFIDPTGRFETSTTTTIPAPSSSTTTTTNDASFQATVSMMPTSTPPPVGAAPQITGFIVLFTIFAVVTILIT